MARKILPLNLRPYRGKQFENFHAPGCRLITASMVPALFGEGPTSRFQMLAHVLGASALPPPDRKVVRRGIFLQHAALKMAAEDYPDIVTTPVEAWSRHPTLERMIASPDGVFTDGSRHGPVEIKVVSPQVWAEQWSEGPPIKTLLQLQTQIACTAAQRGLILCVVCGDRSLELRRPFFVDANQAMIDTIVARVMGDLELIDRNLLPEPQETAPDVRALLRIMPYVTPSETVIMDDPDAMRRFQEWKQASLDRRAAQAREDASRFWFTVRAPSAGVIQVGPFATITTRTIVRQAHAVPQTTSRISRLTVDAEHFGVESSMETQEWTSTI